jgi:hypothetical protein
MRRVLAALALLLAVSAPASAQIIDAGSITAGGADCSTAARCTVFTMPQNAAVTLAVSGTYSGTLQFEASSDNGTTWFAVLMFKLADGSSATSTTGTGQYSTPNAGVTHIRVRCSSYSSGTAVITAVRGYAIAKWLTPFLTSLTLANGTGLADTSGSGTLLITGTTPAIQLGGTTSSFPMLKRNAARLQVQLADNSGAGAIDALSVTTQGGGFAFTGAADAFFLNSSVKLFMNTAPSAPSACGTSPAVTTSNGSVVFVVTGGTGGTATGCTVTMPTATTGWACTINNITGSAAHRADKTTVQTASTTTSVTWEYQTVSTGAAVAFTASDVFRGICFGY